MLLVNKNNFIHIAQYITLDFLYILYIIKVRGENLKSIQNSIPDINLGNVKLPEPLARFLRRLLHLSFTFYVLRHVEKRRFSVLKLP